MMCVSVFNRVCRYLRSDNILGPTNAFLTRLSIYIKSFKKRRDNLSPHVC